MKHLIRNAIRTPDGTVLESHHRHDYKTHSDRITGEEYMVDGGLAYVRCSVNNVPAEDLSVYWDDIVPDCPKSIQIARKVFKWGTRGKNGDQPLVYKPLNTLDTDHIKAILETQHHIADWMRNLFERELEYRK